MKLLVSNDDGVHAPGLEALVQQLQQIAELDVIAPDRNHSGSSSALTLDRPLYPQVHSNGFISVNGTPADCVHLSVTGLLDYMPERVVSGINEGANLGDDVLYSGTVAAALEGRFLNSIAIAISLVGKTHFATAARVACKILTSTDSLNLPINTILNVNVPDLEYEQLKGFKVTRLGYRQKAKPCHQEPTPRGRKCYWIAEAGDPEDRGEGTDFHAVQQGYVSITPLHIDLTRHDILPSVSAWLERLS